MYKKILLNVGFDDSEFDSLVLKSDSLKVTVKLWNGDERLIEFKEVEGFIDYGLDQITAFCEIERHTSFYQEILGKIFGEDVLDGHGYKEYAFLDLEEEIALKVVAKGFVSS